MLIGLCVLLTSVLPSGKALNLSELCGYQRDEADGPSCLDCGEE